MFSAYIYRTKGFPHGQQNYDLPLVGLHRAPGDYPSGKQGDVLAVKFTLMGTPCLGLNGRPIFKHSEAFSFQIANEDPAETDPGQVAAKRAFEAMMQMTKIDIAAIESAR